MTGRLSLFFFLAASGVVHLLSVLPSYTALAALTMTAVLSILFVLRFFARSSRPRRWILPILAGIAGFLLTAARAEHRLQDALAPTNENLVSRVELRVASLPDRSGGGQQFDALVISSVPDGVPRKIRVSWRSGDWSGPYGKRDSAPVDMPLVLPGQVWRMALVLKSPHGLRNPHGFDYEGYAFAQGIRAVATVRGTPVFLRDDPWHSLPVIAERARHHVREAMTPHLEGKRYGAVLLALAIGDQASVDADDWLVFNRTGITHLVSISGSHVTLIAGLGGLAVFVVWRRLRWNGYSPAERFPAQSAAALAALVVAWLYCLLAGWGVPAQRTFLMLSVVALSYVLRLSMSSSRLLLLAAFVVVLLDPWAILSSGFWLSFGAVAVLMTMGVATGRAVNGLPVSMGARICARVGGAVRLQLAITVALLPALALLFNEISIVSPLANAYAIPVISFLVTPLALAAAVIALFPGAEPFASVLAGLAHGVLDVMMQPTQWLAGLGAASVSTAAAPVGLTLLAMAGLLLALLPRGLRGRTLGLVWMLPALCWIPARPPAGSWDAVALDVGQASAIVIRTRNHTVLFDTGIRQSATADSGVRVIWPFLRSLGVSRLDALFVSHADLDHVGGLRSVLEALPTEQSYSSFDLARWLEREAGMLGETRVPALPRARSACHYGQHWEVDGVSFQVLWPLQRAYTSLQSSSRERNDNSCVLRIQGKHHSLLLLGDISAAQERELIRRGIAAHDVVLAAHHGSSTSSSSDFVQATQPIHTVAQAGAWSRYGHPHPAAAARWESAGATVWRSDFHGAVTMRSRKDRLKVFSERDARRRYWQTW